MRSLGRVLKVAVVGLMVGALTVLAVPLTASAAAPSWVEPPTRLYMLPTQGATSAPPLFPQPIPQNELLFDGDTDQISNQVRTLEIESAEDSCDPAPGNNFDFFGCTAVQLSVSHGVLDFTDTPSPQDDPDSSFDVYILPGGAIVRDMDSADDLPEPSPALLGTTAQINAALATLRYTPADDYYTQGESFNPENLHAVLVPGDDALSTVSIDVQIRVQDYNNAPSLSVPVSVTNVDPGNDVTIGVDDDWTVEDEDNDDAAPDNDGKIDGDGSDFLVVGWTTCGLFSYGNPSGFLSDDNIPDLLFEAIDADVVPTPEQQDAVADMAARLPSELFGLTYENENSNEWHEAWVGLADDITEVNDALDDVQFRAQDSGGNNLGDTTCQVFTFVADLGNNGLPLASVPYVDPPFYVETPFIQFDLPKPVAVKVGQGGELELSLTGTPILDEGTSGSVTLNISPAEHPAFTVNYTRDVGLGAMPGTDYTGGPGSILVPADETSVDIPVDALLDGEIDPGEYYFVNLAPSTAPDGWELTVTDGAEQVVINDIDGVGVDAPTATVGQAAGQIDPAFFSPILFTVVFSEAVTGFSEDDLDFTGSTAGGSLGANITGSGEEYQVAVQGMTTSGTVVLSIPAGAAIDASNNPSEAAVPGDNSVYWTQVDPSDSTAPTVFVDKAAGQSDPANIAPIVFDVTFSEPVTGFTPLDVVANGTANPQSVLVTGAGTDYQILVSGMTQNGDVTVFVAGSAAVDPNGNASENPTYGDNTVAWLMPDPGDTTPPTVSIEQGAAQADPTSTSPIVFEVLFSEQVTGFTAADIDFTGTTAGPVVASVSGIGPAYVVEVTGMTMDGDVVASIQAAAAQDAAANDSDASTSVDNSVSWVQPLPDVTSPDVTINQGASQGDPTPFFPIVFDVEFTEPVTGFDSTDVDLSGTALPTNAVVNGSGAIYTVEVSGMSAAGTVIASIPAGAAEDAATNASTASTSTDNEVTFQLVDPGDMTPPTVTVDQAVGQADPTSTSPILFDVVFSEPITDFTAGDLSITGTAGATTAFISGGGPAYVVNVSGMTSSGTVTLALPAARVVDGNGNANLASQSTDNTVMFDLVEDTTAPTVTIDQAAAQADPTTASPILFEVEFSEPVVGFVTGDVQLSGTAGATTATVSGSGTDYTVEVTGMVSSGTVIASIPAAAAADLAANDSAASTSTDNTVTFTLDTTDPTVTVNQGAAQSDPSSTSPIVFDVLFSEPVNGLAATDFDASASTVGGTLDLTLSGTGPAYTISVTGMATAGDVIVTLPANVATDDAGNPNEAGTFTDNVVAWAPLAVPLQLTLPDDITVQAATGESGAIVTFAPPTASGGTPPLSPVVCDHVSGEFYPIGVTTVTCTVSDAEELQSVLSVTSSFTITVTAAPPAAMPVTGVNAGPIIAFGLLLLVAGGLVLLFVRRRLA